jgi:hypothetical protein
MSKLKVFLFVNTRLNISAVALNTMIVGSAPEPGPLKQNPLAEPDLS